MIALIYTSKIKIYQNSIFLFIFLFFISCKEDSLKYNDKDVVTILSLSIKELTKKKEMIISKEFAPRLERSLSDDEFFKNKINRLKIPQDKKIEFRKVDVKYMHSNNRIRFKQKKEMTDFITINDSLLIKTDSYYSNDSIRLKFFKNLKYRNVLRLSFPYISKNKKVAVIGYEIICEGLCGIGGKIYFYKNKNNQWVIYSKNQDWVS